MAGTAATAGALYDELRRSHGFTLAPERLRVAVNDEFRPWATELRDADSVTGVLASRKCIGRGGPKTVKTAK